MGQHEGLHIFFADVVKFQDKDKVLGDGMQEERLRQQGWFRPAGFELCPRRKEG
jgi:hypothetical protein